jgi:spore photoproduct lyase
MKMKTNLIKTTKRKSFLIRPSGRSTDYISPSFGWGCLYDCGYCYMKRHKPEGLSIASNTGDILTALNNHAYFYTDVEKPNQTHESLITYDISCNEDFALHAKHHDWQRIFAFFRDHPIAMGSFATKFVNNKLLEFNPEGKIRIRFSLMPQKYADILEPNTSEIIDRIKAINNFIEAGYDVHINFSPVVITDNWLNDYKDLFQQVDTYVKDEYKHLVKAEVIFLTHSRDKHKYNLEHQLPGEELIWRPDIQEDKVSQYGGPALRYKSGYKAERIKEFLELKDQIIPWNTTRYAF